MAVGARSPEHYAVCCSAVDMTIVLKLEPTGKDGEK
jgi:hypothetical protein